jgi:NADPH:quinone reductase-like Zn-dependent oxidoreductase
VFSWSAQVNATRCGEGAGRWFGTGRQLPAIALSPFVRQRLATLIASKNRNDLDALRTLIEDGAVTTVIDRVCSIPEVPDAMRDLEACRVGGKVVVAI